jgi:hypothetical protein
VGRRKRIRQDGRTSSPECPDCRTRTVFSVNPKALQSAPPHCWCDKAGHEADFVAARRERPPLAIECTWSAADLSTENLRAFRSRYPVGENIVVAQDADRSATRSFGGIRVTVEPLRGLIRPLLPLKRQTQKPSSVSRMVIWNVTKKCQLTARYLLPIGA